MFSGPFGSGSSYSYRGYFEHWLVLKQDDGRLAYIPPSAVKYLEQAAPKDRCESSAAGFAIEWPILKGDPLERSYLPRSTLDPFAPSRNSPSRS